jgi:hypothetical protein
MGVEIVNIQTRSDQISDRISFSRRYNSLIAVIDYLHLVCKKELR